MDEVIPEYSGKLIGQKPILDHIPQELKDMNQWVTWKMLTRDEASQKMTKVPFKVGTGQQASSTKREDWTAFNKAWKAFSRSSKYSGVGFVLSDADDYAVIDLDNCITDDNEIKPEADAIIKRLASYAEVSPSLKGIKIWIRGVKPGFGLSTPLGENGYKAELFTQARYLTVTGWAVPGCPSVIQERSTEFYALCEELAPGSTVVPTTVKFQGEWVEREVDPNDDETVLKLARSAKNGDKFRRLYDKGDTTGYASESEADMALLTLLAYWTDGGHAQMERLMRGSALARPKWDDKRKDTTWVGSQIVEACEFAAASQHARVAKTDTPEQSQRTEARMRTDLGNAERFRDRHGDNLRYVAQTGQWLIWNGVCWHPDTKGEIYLLAKETIRNIYAEALAEPDDDKRGKIAQWAAASEALSRVNAMITLASKEEGIATSLDLFDTNPWLLGCQNGTIDLRSGKLLEPLREHYITKQVPVRFDAAAKSRLWLKTIEKLQPDPIMRSYLQRALGYTLTGETTEQCFYFLYGMGQKANGEAGNGANGKSTVIETFLELMGDYALKARIETFLQARQGNNNGPTPEILKFRGCRLIVGSEVGMGVQLDTSFIKDITGNDRISARTHYKEPVEFRPNCKIWLYGNYKPGIKGSDEGTWRRPRLIEFPTHIEPEDRDKALGEKLKAELPGILNWAIEGCLAWQREGMNDPTQVLASVQEYRQEMDLIGQFLGECTQEQADSRLPGKDLYQAYTSWCEENGCYKQTKHYFTLRIKERGFKTVSRDGYPVWVGLRLRSSTEHVSRPQLWSENVERMKQKLAGDHTFKTTPTEATVG